MIAAVYRQSGYPSDDPLVTPDVVLDAVNEALGLIGTEADWPWLRASTTITTAAGDGLYALPSDYARTVYLVDPDGEPIARLDERQLEEDYTDDQGSPEAWAIVGGEVALRPVPDAVLAFSHHYVRTEKVLVEDSDEPYLPVQFHPGAVVLAVSFAHEAGMNEKRADRARDRYEKLWRPRMQDDRRRARGPLRQRIRAGSAF